MNQTCRKLGIAFILIAFLVGCAPAETPPSEISPTGASPASSTPAPPAYWPTDGWRSTAPEEQGMDSEKLAQMVEHIQQEKLDLHSLLIVRNGYLVSELYAYPYSAEQAHWIMSVTKSVIGALVGIAIQKGYYQRRPPALVQSAPGSGSGEPRRKEESHHAGRFADHDFRARLPRKPGARGSRSCKPARTGFNSCWTSPWPRSPGRQFNYCTGAVELLSAVLQKATGMSAREFANQNLFAPARDWAHPGSALAVRSPGSDDRGIRARAYPGRDGQVGFLIPQPGAMGRQDDRAGRLGGRLDGQPCQSRATRKNMDICGGSIHRGNGTPPWAAPGSTSLSIRLKTWWWSSPPICPTPTTPTSSPSRSCSTSISFRQ